jgi:hypothetical protein
VIGQPLESADLDAAQALIEANRVVLEVPAFIKVLDAVSDIHPAVQVCLSDRLVDARRDVSLQASVGAFKIVYSITQARTENDAKIIELHIAMREMIAVLCQ